ncbi:hypothetical protein KDK95_17950 [Actinospica sp. MGRD01-02]|uniref:Penicillin-binding protein transpeptidase domain-containing protein n=1 Tax=Actinospica acidithermotolerans TaxID=2828514 RepID=A0A941ECY8_9ACTN|nr:penicillin-binding transpeptidase domain-containing protein [Actinospica acidithermotolerans]MBR7828202.1 hypothetical protein [Actinospica acidithermotolerans]
MIPSDAERPRSRRRLALAGGIGAAGIVALAAVLIVHQTGLSRRNRAGTATSGFQPTATTIAGDAQQTAAAFLAAWQSGNFQQAAAYTDDAATAQSALTSYANGLNLHGLHLATTGTSTPANKASAQASASASASAGANPSGTVTFSVAATVGITASSTAAPSSASAAASGASPGSGVTATWSYTSKLTAYQKNGGWWVKWDNSLIAPNLTAGEKVVSAAVPPTASKVVDASGDDLSTATDPGVRNIAAALKKDAPAGQGTDGVEVELEKADGTVIPGTADVLVKPVDTGVVTTTIDPKVEAAAQAAAATHSDSSMVVIRPSTGAILAVANNDGQNDFALTARVAPGSTNKIITSTALLANSLIASPSTPDECPASLTVNGTVFHNDTGMSEPATTPFLTDFAVSCNDAFAKWYSKVGSTTLAQTAQKYYGLNEQWNFGTGEAGPYYTLPASASNGELAQELFGQGQIEASPLAMASVAATVDTGDFKQPIVIPGQAQITATPLPANVKQDLWQLMKAVTTESDGTAYNVFTGVNSQVYGKTGTADVGGGGSTAAQAKPNSWMVVFDPTLDLAIGCVALDAGYGASVAGPEEASVLKALQ